MNSILLLEKHVLNSILLSGQTPIESPDWDSFLILSPHLGFCYWGSLSKLVSTWRDVLIILRGLYSPIMERQSCELQSRSCFAVKKMEGMVWVDVIRIFSDQLFNFDLWLSGCCWVVISVFFYFQQGFWFSNILSFTLKNLACVW